MYFQDKTIDQNIQWFYKTYDIDHDEFQQRWLKYRRCSFEFLQLDLHSSDAGRRIGTMAQSSVGAYIWTSNSFYMDYQMFYRSRAGMQGLFERFVRDIRDTANTDVVLENCNHITVL